MHLIQEPTHFLSLFSLRVKYFVGILEHLSFCVFVQSEIALISVLNVLFVVLNAVFGVTNAVKPLLKNGLILIEMKLI